MVGGRLRGGALGYSGGADEEGAPHIVPLSTQAREVLSMLRELDANSVWIFAGERSQLKPMSYNTILKSLERMGYKARMTGHGFRGLASTILHEQGYPH